MATAATTGSLFTWGFGGHGQLGHTGAAAERDCPGLVTGLFRVPFSTVSCGGTFTYATDGSGRAYWFGGANTSAPRESVGMRKRHIVRIACGGMHCVAIERVEDGTEAAKTAVWEWQVTSLGGETTPVAVAGLGGVKVTQIAAGGAFSVALIEGGTPFAWGINSKGQCGLGDARERKSPQQVVGLSGVAKVACGGQHTLFLDATHRVFACGSNRFGQLGVGDTADRNVPTPVLPGGVEFTDVCCGDNHSVGVSDLRAPLHSEVFAWGRKAQCGIHSENDVLSPTALDSMNTILSAAAEKVSSVSASGSFGHAHTAIVTATGRLFTFGSSNNGQCGVIGVKEVLNPTVVEAFAPHKGRPGMHVLAASCGWLHSAAIVTSVVRESQKQGIDSPYGLFEPLGNDLIVFILSHLNHRDLVSVSLTSRGLHSLASTNGLWYGLFCRAGYCWRQEDQSWESGLLSNPNSKAAKLSQSWATAARISPSDTVWKTRFVRRFPGSSVYLQDVCVPKQESAVSVIAKAFRKLVGRKSEARCLLGGLDASGKTTILYKLKLGEVVTTIPTIGFNVESVAYKQTSFTMWDLGGEDKIRPLWRHYFQNTSAVFWVVDSNDADRLRSGEVQGELDHFLEAEELRDAVFCFLLNKQDLPNALTIREIREILHLDRIRDRPVMEFATCAISGDGLYEALDWVESKLR